MAERNNRYIMDMVINMLYCKKLPKSFLAEAVTCAIYILNRCLIKSVHDKTPQEVWSGQKPNLSHMRVLGCIAYSRWIDVLRKKLDDKADKCIFIGYNIETKGHK